MDIDRLEIGFAGARGFDPEDFHLSVDGMTPRGPNLSHWPGNRTPPRYKADLSTGICLNFARAPRAEQRDFLAGVAAVVNDHYDTDGFLSLLAVTRPDLALAEEATCLSAAVTGDYGAYHTQSGFAIDRIVTHPADRHSPFAAEFAGLGDAERALARYRWLIAQAERVLAVDSDFDPLWRDEWRVATEELRACRDGGIVRGRAPALGLSIVQSTGPLRRMTLNTLAGAFRVLHAIGGGDGFRFRYHDRTESWFEVVSFTPLPRVDLRPLAARLQTLEGDAAADARWCADPPDVPVPELWFGRDEPQAYGAVTRELAPSRLRPATVRAEFLHHLEGAAAAPSH